MAVLVFTLPSLESDPKYPFFCHPMYPSRQYAPRQNITRLEVLFFRKLWEWEGRQKSLTTIYTSVRTTAKLSWGSQTQKRREDTTRVLCLRGWF